MDLGGSNGDGNTRPKAAWRGAEEEEERRREAVAAGERRRASFVFARGRLAAEEVGASKRQGTTEEGGLEDYERQVSRLGRHCVGEAPDG
jgi:hypothetical protein